jgi:hypothetical protein
MPRFGAYRIALYTALVGMFLVMSAGALAAMPGRAYAVGIPAGDDRLLSTPTQWWSDTTSTPTRWRPASTTGAPG